jgi:hypothetical protein
MTHASDTLYEKRECRTDQAIAIDQARTADTAAYSWRLTCMSWVEINIRVSVFLMEYCAKIGFDHSNNV